MYLIKQLHLLLQCLEPADLCKASLVSSSICKPELSHPMCSVEMLAEAAMLLSIRFCRCVRVCASRVMPQAGQRAADLKTSDPCMSMLQGLAESTMQAGADSSLPSWTAARPGRPCMQTHCS